MIQTGLQNESHALIPRKRCLLNKIKTYLPYLGRLKCQNVFRKLTHANQAAEIPQNSLHTTIVSGKTGMDHLVPFLYIKGMVPCDEEIADMVLCLSQKFTLQG